MGLLKERLKRASKNQSVPVATTKPTIKMSLPPVQQVLGTEEIVDNDNSDNEQYNVTYHVLHESNHEQNLEIDSNNSSSGLTSISRQIDSTFTTTQHPPSLENGFR